MPYGAPPGWYPPPGHGFPQGPGQFPPNMPVGPPGQQPPQQRPGPPAAAAPKPTSELPVGDKVLSKPASRNPTPAAQNAPTPPVESKPSVAEATQGFTGPGAQRNGRVVPVVPIAAPKPVIPTSAPNPAAPASAPITDATAAATAAVAAAMSKLPQPGAQKKFNQHDATVDSMTRKMNEMRTFDSPRTPRGGHQYPRGGRGGARNPQKKFEVPQSDYDFQTANARFNKQDLVKEAIASGSPAAEAEVHAHVEEEITGESFADSSSASTQNVYNRGSSFFDNISSEARDREEHSTVRLGGREWRGEEEKRNIETFGQGSVDGYRGRGRGRGRGFGRGRGYSRGYGGRGRGGRAPSQQSTGVPSLG